MLKQEHKRCKTIKQADRIKTILCLNKGLSYESITELLLLDDSTLRRYFNEYQEGGIYKLLSDNFRGGTPKLTIEEQIQLDQHLEDNIYLTSKEIVAYVENEFGIFYTINGMTSFLHNLGYTYKKPKHIPGKADKEKQTIFIEEYEDLKATKSTEDKIYFMDGCHPQHNSQPAYGWIKKGVQKELKSNSGRQRINLNGAYNLEDHEVTIREDEMINSQSTIKLFEQLSQRQKTGIIYIICDNARYYKSILVNEYLETNKRLKIVFLPPYSPNLNIIERLWKFFKKNITYNKYCENFAVFKEKCMEFFQNIEKYKSELESLMTDNFQLIQA
ncbi:IS630 family transposase [bacterium]|nr:IS630 family transposase [bacterium]MBU1677231.1 IS630 family transposase [bacterium]